MSDVSFIEVESAKLTDSPGSCTLSYLVHAAMSTDIQPWMIRSVGRSVAR